jgi:anaerobic magnesium-protoporphyrin IX monomethyl ester cyclase
MKFLLLQIPPRFVFSSEVDKPQKISSYHPPLGLLYLGAVLEKEANNVEIIDFLAEHYPLETVKKNLASSDAVGISVFSSAYNESMHGGRYTYAYKESAKVAELIKSIDSKIPIIIGGPHCSIQPRESLNEISCADISIEGDGEQVITEIGKALEGKKTLANIQGIYYRENNQIKKGKPAKFIEDLDSIPFPARHLIDKYDYSRAAKSNFFKPKFTSMITGRGCPFNCSFCTRNTLGFKTFRKRSVENVVNEIQEINKSYNSVMIVDDTFLADEERANNILDRLIEIGTDIDIYIQGARVDTAKRELFLKMKKAGVKHLYYGLESGNQDVLSFYNKNVTVDQIRKAIILSSEMDFFTAGTFILGAPIETKKHIENTIRFATSLPLDVVIFTILTYKFGSQLWDEAVKSGKISRSDGYTVVADRSKGLGNFTREELEEFYRIAMKRFYIRPRYLIRQILKVFKNEDFNAIKARLNRLTSIVS